MMRYNKGWKFESERHSLAARKIRTGRKPVSVYSGDRLVGKFNIFGMKTLKAGGFSAGTVLQQLGGNKFVAMTGANSFVKDDSKQEIAFKIGRNSLGVNWVRITLNPADTYDMEFMSVRNGVLKLKSKADGVYNDQLQEVFTEHTGMHTSLTAKGRRSKAFLSQIENIRYAPADERGGILFDIGGKTYRVDEPRNVMPIAEVVADRKNLAATIRAKKWLTEKFASGEAKPLAAKGESAYKYKVDKNINPGYTHWVYFKTKSDALKYVRSHPAYPTVQQHVYRVSNAENIRKQDIQDGGF